MCKAHNQLTNHLIFPNGSGNRRHNRIFGYLIYEVLAVKTPNSLTAKASHHRGHVVHIRLRDNGRHRGIHAAVDKLIRDVLVEQIVESAFSVLLELP